MKSKEIHELFSASSKTLCFAESITGGKLATSLVQYPGASSYFLGDIVAYCNEAKIDLLGVSKETLRKFGAVSKEVALEMAQGAKKKFHADFAVATTGVAGPDGTPVGSVFLALASPKQVVSFHFLFNGNRSQIIDQTCEECFTQLFAFVKAFDKTK